MIARLILANVRWILLAFAVLAVLVWAYGAWTASPNAEARLGRNQAEAASESGADAVNTVGAAGEREAKSADLTRANDVEIRNAEGADAKVSPAADAAGRASLCRRAAYRNDPKCV